MKKEEIEQLAEQIKLLLSFSSQLIPYREHLEEVVGISEDKSSSIMAMAPLITATGEDYESMHLQAQVKRKRAEALLNLVDVLIETEDDIKTAKEKKQLYEKHRAALRSILG